MVDLDKLTYAGHLDSLADVMDDPRHVFGRGSICDERLVRGLLEEHRPRATVNFAAESRVDRSIDGPAEFVQANVAGTCRALEAARRYRGGLSQDDGAASRFLQVSTDEVFGSLGPAGGLTETSANGPDSPYSASKAAADHFARAYRRTYGLPVADHFCCRPARAPSTPRRGRGNAT